MDQREFIHRMNELAELGQSKGNTLTKEEVAEFCHGLSLTEEQLQMVYDYLAERGICVPGTGRGEGKNEVVVPEDSEDETLRSDSKYISIYRRQLRELPEYTKEMVEELYERLRQGDESAVSAVIEAHLKKVATMAGKFKGKGVPLEDLIQEGNLALVTCVSSLTGNREVADFKKAINRAVKSRLIELVEEEIEDMDGIRGILARINLLYEATKVLAEEYGRVATIGELSEFTKMDEEEIRMYVDFSRKKIELGSGEGENEQSE